MTEKQLRKLSRMELLEILLKQRKKIDALEKQLEEVQKEAEDRRILISQKGSIAEASLALTKVFQEAQKAADLYLDNIRGTVNRVNTMHAENARTAAGGTGLRTTPDTGSTVK